MMARIATKILVRMTLSLVAAHAFTGCKALEPEYVKYGDGENRSTEPSGEGAEKSPSGNGQNTQCDPFAAYKTHLKSGIDNVCSYRSGKLARHSIGSRVISYSR